MNFGIIRAPLGSTRSLLTLLLIAAGATALWAAEVTANIAGTVKDPSGAIVPSATVTLTNTKTNTSRVFTTRDDGSYFPATRTLRPTISLWAAETWTGSRFTATGLNSP